MKPFAAWLILFFLCFNGCGKKSTSRATPVPSTPIPAASPERLAQSAPIPTTVATPTPPVVEANKDARVIVLCYHRFEDKPKDSLAIKPLDFEGQMNVLKANNIAVIAMQDFLAWRRNEKVIPPRCAVITIDDGYVSGYTVAWPILKRFGYPFTMFVYTNYIKGGPNSGGQSISWEQLEEMRDAGVEVQSHTVSHADLRSKIDPQTKKPHAAGYEAWLDSELGDSKRIIENKLGTQVTALAYPYGLNNEVVRAAGLKAGYEALFTVYGQTIGWGGEPDIIGRHAIDSTKPQIFVNAVKFQAPFSGQISAVPANTEAPVFASQMASASMITEPISGSTISESRPMIRANLATMGELEPNSVQMLISGFGIVPAKYDPTTKMISYQVQRSLQPQLYKVIVEGRVKGRKVETQWSFSYAR